MDPPRVALRQPRSLTTGQPDSFDITTSAIPSGVAAWVLSQDSVQDLVRSYAIAWTRRAVKVRWQLPPRADMGLRRRWCQWPLSSARRGRDTCPRPI